MEQQLFSWEEWDILDEGQYVYYKCTLKECIAEFKPGRYFDQIMMDYMEGKIVLQRDGIEYTYKLQLIVVE